MPRSSKAKSSAAKDAKKSQPREKKAQPKTPSIKSTYAKKSDLKSLPVVFQPVEDACGTGSAFEIERLLTPAEVMREYTARQKVLDAQFRKARKLLTAWWPKLKRSKEYRSGHITGVSVRFKTRFGFCISPLKVVIAINVRRKLDVDQLETHSIRKLPTSVRFKQKDAEEFEVKVLEGSFRPIGNRIPGESLRGTTLPKDPLPLAQPVVGGASIAPPNQDIDFGTMGVVYSVAAGGAMGLTCSHVVDNGPNVDQWGELDNAGKVKKRNVATVGAGQSRIADIREETVDCAAIKLEPPSATLLYPTTAGAFIRNLNTAGALFAGRSIFFADSPINNITVAGLVYKFGAALGIVSTGIVQADQGSIYVIGGRDFRNNFTVKSDSGNGVFVEPGDSGALLVTDTNVDGSPALLAIGILFGQPEDNSSVGIACSMRNVLKALGTEIATASRAVWKGTSWKT